MITPTRDAIPPPQATGPIPLRALLRDRAFLLYLTGQTTSGAAVPPSP